MSAAERAQRSRARTFLNAADARAPEASAESLSGPVWRRMAARLDAPGGAVLARALRWLEWEARLLGGAPRGFSWQGREARRARLDAWSRSRWAWKRALPAALDEALAGLDAPHASGAHSDSGP